MTRIALALIVAMLLPPAAGAQEPGGEASEREKVLAGFALLVDRGNARPMFGLSPSAFWRREGGLDIALFAEDPEGLRPDLEGAAAPFAAVSGQAIAVTETAALEGAANDVAALAPGADLVVVVGPRPRLAAMAAAGGFSLGMLDFFELGTWPFVFDFEADAQRRGVVLLADDEPARARTAAFIVATVWALGGVTLGPELTGLVVDSDTGPALTERGEAVFGLFFHEDLEVGMPLGEALRRAETLLPQ